MPLSLRLTLTSVVLAIVLVGLALWLTTYLLDGEDMSTLDGKAVKEFGWRIRTEVSHSLSSSNRTHLYISQLLSSSVVPLPTASTPQPASTVAVTCGALEAYMALSIVGVDGTGLEVSKDALQTCSSRSLLAQEIIQLQAMAPTWTGGGASPALILGANLTRWSDGRGYFLAVTAAPQLFFQSYTQNSDGTFPTWDAHLLNQTGSNLFSFSYRSGVGYWVGSGTVDARSVPSVGEALSGWSAASGRLRLASGTERWIQQNGKQLVVFAIDPLPLIAVVEIPLASDGSGSKTALGRKYGSGMIAFACLAVAAQLAVGLITLSLTVRPLSHLAQEIDKSSQMALLQHEAFVEDDVDRIGGFELLGREEREIRDLEQFHDPNSLMNPNFKESSVKEVAALQRGFQEMLTVIRSFTLYVPHDVVKRLIVKGELASLSMSHRIVTIMFIDVENFTQLCESIKERRLVRIMEIYFGISGEVIADSGGTVDKYIGDAVMAIWGAPTQLDNLNIRASLAALMIQSQISDPDTQDVIGDVGFKIRVGLHTGRALCGNLGSRKRMNFTALGDAVNLASRLEGLNKDYGTRIMVSHAVAKELHGVCCVRQLGRSTVKGKSIATDIFELVGVTPDALARAEQGLLQTNVGVGGPLDNIGRDPETGSSSGNSIHAFPNGVPFDSTSVIRRKGSVSSQRYADRKKSVVDDATATHEGSTAWDLSTAALNKVSAEGGAYHMIHDVKFTVQELLLGCRDLIVDDVTIEFCALYSKAVQEYLRGEFGQSLETFALAGHRFDEATSNVGAGDAVIRRRTMDVMVQEMQNIMNSGFGGGMGNFSSGGVGAGAGLPTSHPSGQSPSTRALPLMPQY